MKPYYEHAGITIYHGDCRDFCLYADVVLTDPPYGVGLSASRPEKMRKHAGETYTFGDDSEEYIRQVCVPAIVNLLNRLQRVVLTSGTRCMWLYPRPTTVWCLYWPNGAGRGRWSAFNCWQPVLCYGVGPQRVGAIPDTFMTTEQAEWNGHPCPKPLPLWKRLLAATSSPGETVLDPFCGSGTTLVAAKDLGRKAIGIEIEEKYCEIAAKRLSQEVLDFEGCALEAE